MKFEEGKPKTGGRTKGTPNKKTAVLDSFAMMICEGHAERFEQELNNLEGREYVNAFLSLFEYVKPKLSRMEMKAEVEATVKKVGYGEDE